MDRGDAGIRASEAALRFYLGCAVWGYKGWNGRLFPEKTKPSECLSLYSRHFKAVEGNTTFYGVPDRETVMRWAQQTPREFRFCMKLPRFITHRGLFVDVQRAIADAHAFVELIQTGLDGRAGPFFLQLPPQFDPSMLDALRTFLEAFPRDSARLLVEVRHPLFFQAHHHGRLVDLLIRFGVGRVLLDSRPMYEGEGYAPMLLDQKKPNLPLFAEVTAAFSLVRFVSHPEAGINRPYFEEWTGLCAEFLKRGTEIFFFMHCPEETFSPDNAALFHQMLMQSGLSVHPLPWSRPQRDQLRLF